MELSLTDRKKKVPLMLIDKVVNNIIKRVMKCSNSHDFLTTEESVALACDHLTITKVYTDYSCNYSNFSNRDGDHYRDRNRALHSLHAPRLGAIKTGP